MSSVETGQMSAVETGQVSAAETGQMSAFGTRRMPSGARKDVCLVSTHNVEVSEVCSVPMFKSQKSQLFKSQKGGLALNRRKWPEMGPEWSPGSENRPPSFSRPLSRLWDRSCGPKPAKKVKKWSVWGLALGLSTVAEMRKLPLV